MMNYKLGRNVDNKNVITNTLTIRNTSRIRNTKMSLRFLGHLFRRKNPKMLRIGIILFICIGLSFLAVHHSDDIMKFDIPYISADSNEINDAYGDYKPITSSDKTSNSKNANLREVLSTTIEKIREFSPQTQFDRKNGGSCRIGDIHLDDVKSFDKLTKSELLKCVNLPDTARDEMKDLHKSFLSVLKEELLPSYPPDLYKGEGIVMVAGGKFTLIGLPAIKAIRANGNKNIPIEIMIPPDNNGEDAFCERILPELDPSGASRCVYMEKLFDEKLFKSVKGYQLKSLALLASSFQHALLLDADNYIINSIENLFNATPYKENGLVLWPDYWRRLHHPSIYDIAGMKVGTNKQVRYSIDNVSPSEAYKADAPENAPFHDLEGTIPDSSTESGQLLVDKSKHLDTIILSLYYNFNGPTHYYPLLGQGYAGEGDKDTFALAAKALHPTTIGESYYQVKSPVGTMGHWTFKIDETLILDSDDASEDEKQFRGVAMLQHDLTADYHAYTEAKNNISAKYKKALDSYRERNQKDASTEEYNSLLHGFWQEERQNGDYDLMEFRAFFDKVPVTFVHSHLPKYNPWEFGESQDMTFNGRKVISRHKGDPDFTPLHEGHYRMYNDDFMKISNYDLELENWACFQDFICDKENGYYNFSYLKEQVESSPDGEEKYKDMCAYISERVRSLRSSTWV